MERSHATFHIKRGLRFSHCYFIRAVHSALEKVAFAPVKFSRCFGRCFRPVFRLALCARTVCAVVHRFSALPALHGFHRARAHRSARYTRSDTAPTFGVHVRGAIPDACRGMLSAGATTIRKVDTVRTVRASLDAARRSWGVPPWSVSIIARVYPLVNPFFKKIFRAVFFKDNENARARSGSQNRRKQAKTEVLNAEKFFEKNQKKRAKKIFPSCCTTAPRPDSTAPGRHPAPIDRGTADRVHQKRRSIENCMIQSYPQGKTVINRVFHKIDTVSIF